MFAGGEAGEGELEFGDAVGAFDDDAIGDEGGAGIDAAFPEDAGEGAAGAAGAEGEGDVVVALSGGWAVGDDPVLGVFGENVFAVVFLADVDARGGGGGDRNSGGGECE